MDGPVSTAGAANSEAASDYFRIELANDFVLTVHLNMVIVGLLLLALGLLLAIRHYLFKRRLPEFEFEEAGSVSATRRSSSRRTTSIAPSPTEFGSS